jgi:hypothetical protein
MQDQDYSVDERFYPATDDCDWEPLREHLGGSEALGEWMFMAATTDGRRFYKHRVTRERLALMGVSRPNPMPKEPPEGFAIPENERRHRVDRCDRSDLIEVVYMRYGSVYLHEAESIEGALAFIQYSEDDGWMSSVGVYVNGEPRICGGYADQEPPTPAEVEMMREAYRKANRA